MALSRLGAPLESPDGARATIKDRWKQNQHEKKCSRSSFSGYMSGETRRTADILKDCNRSNSDSFDASRRQIFTLVAVVRCSSTYPFLVVLCLMVI